MKILDEIQSGVWVDAFFWTTVYKERHKLDYIGNEAHHRTPEADPEIQQYSLKIIFNIKGVSGVKTNAIDLC